MTRQARHGWRVIQYPANGSDTFYCEHGAGRTEESCHKPHATREAAEAHCKKLNESAG